MPGQLVAGTAIPFPDHAYEVERYLLKKESANQLNFKMDVPYPNFEIITFYLKTYIEKGWSACEGGKAWVTYLKRINDSNKNISVRQRMRYMVNKNEKKLLMVSLHYYGEPADGKDKKIKWDHDVQHATVVLYNLNVGTFDETVSTLELECKQ
jgi:hypothetical protein